MNIKTGKNKPGIDMIGFPMDLGANRRGVDMGPSALRIAGIANKLSALGYRVHDKGDLRIKHREGQKIANPKLKYLTEIVRASEILAKKVEKSLAQGHLPLCIGGDHSMAIGSICGVASFCRNTDESMGVIWIDAHADMNDEQSTPSGNIHGMSLAASLGIGNRRLTHLMGFAPKVKAENCTLIGIRSIDAREKDIVRKLKLNVFTMTDIDRKGIGAVINDVLERMNPKVNHIHVSFDLDSVDPSVAAGVGTPVSGGLNYREAHLIMESIAECGCMSSMDISEVNPILDHNNQSAEFAADLVASILGKRIL